MNPDRKKNSRPSGPSGPNPGKGKQTERPSYLGKPAAEEAEPTAGSSPAPIWLIILFGFLFYWGGLYLDNHAGGFNPQVYEPYASERLVKAVNTRGDDAVARGEALYAQVCAVCHGATGLGSAATQFPPLAGSEWVTAPSSDRLIRIPLHGLTGPIQVKGQEWNNPSGMTAIGGSLPDQDLAAILTYIRQAWGNAAPPVTPEQVAKVRQETSDRPSDGTRPWTADELQKVPIQ